MFAMNLRLFSAALVCYMVAVGIFALTARSADRSDSANSRVLAQGQKIYAANCAVCHGAHLEGQSNWQTAGADGRMPAPPHDESGHTWHHPDEYLIHVVEQGIVPGVDRPTDYQGNMPAFGKTLRRDDVIAVLSFIKSRWSYDYRVWQERTNKPSAKSAGAS